LIGLVIRNTIQIGPEIQEMAESNLEKRAKIRALVEQVLATVPTAGDTSQAHAQDFEPEHVVVKSLEEKNGREWDRDESAKTLITEDDLRGLEAGARLRVAENVRFTSLAEDLIRERGLQLIRKAARKAQSKVRSVAIGSDHGGFRLKEQLKSHLADMGLNIRDFGTESEDAVDYPDFAHAVAKSVAGKQVEIGIIIDGAGIGSAITANKVPGVRAAQCYSPALARNSREHNGANVLTLGAGQNDFEQIKQIVEAFVTSDITEERHKKRVSKIENIDRQYRS
jgi:ribose 5-phosphate isomerase B